jgi:hypothetical protein
MAPHTSLPTPFPSLGAMMGRRQIFGAIPVERKVVCSPRSMSPHPQFEGRTVAEAFQARCLTGDCPGHRRARGAPTGPQPGPQTA